MMSHAVHHGEDHKSSHSYTKSIVTNSPSDNHLLRKRRGQFRTGRKNLRARFRTSMKGHARQKKFPASSKEREEQRSLPASSSTNTRAPRKCTHVYVVARFCGASCGPKSPCKII